MGKHRGWHHHVQEDAKHYAPWMAIGHRNGVHKEACCDCGLTHDAQYRVMARTEDGEWVPVDMRRMKIEKRVRCNMRTTAAMRRGKDHAEVREAVKAKRVRQKREQAL